MRTDVRRLRMPVAVAALALVAGCGSGGGKIAPPSPALGTVVDFTLPSTIANLPLTTSEGTKTSLAAYRGRPVMIADFMTDCTDICPMISANTAALARALTADGYGGKVALLEISMDPERDTLPRLRAYRKLFGAPLADWALLRASHADTLRLWRYLGLEMKRVKEGSPPDKDWLTHKPLTYDIEHSDELIFLDAAGHERFVVSASPNVQGRALPRTLANILGPQGRHLLHHPDPVTSWTVGQGLSVFSWLVDHRLTLPE
ncbi:MAG TPA: SCO family protein [Mycobacteriales bacterium]|nr:SCO family protein [Mycobacteriales bacterium]